MSEQDRLGRLEVGRPGQDRVPSRSASPTSARSSPTIAASRRRWPAATRGGGPSRPGRSATGRCGAAGERADPRGERRLEVEVDVLEGRVPGDVPASTSLGSPSAPRRARRPRRRSAARLVRARGRGRANRPGRRARARRSISIERVKSAIRGPSRSLNRPPQSPHRPSRPCWAAIVPAGQPERSVASSSGRAAQRPVEQEDGRPPAAARRPPRRSGRAATRPAARSRP